MNDLVYQNPTTSPLVSRLIEPFVNFKENWISNPGHEEGSSYIGLGESGGQGARDQFIGGVSTLVAPAGGVALKTVSAVGSILSQVNSWEDALVMSKRSFGVTNDPIVSDADRKRLLGYLEINSIISSASGAWHEFGTADQSRVSGKIGTLADISGALSGMVKTASVQKMIGENPFGVKNLTRNIAGNSVEAALGIAGRFADAIPGMRQSPLLDSLFGFIGGASQNYAATRLPLSEEQRQSAINLLNNNSYRTGQ